MADQVPTRFEASVDVTVDPILADGQDWPAFAQRDFHLDLIIHTEGGDELSRYQHAIAAALDEAAKQTRAELEAAAARARGVGDASS